MDPRGAAPSSTAVREIANILLAQRGQSPLETVGQKQAYNFTRRQSEIKGRYSRRYGYQRAKNETPAIIQQWFNLLLGLSHAAEYYGRRLVLQPGNRE